MLGALIDNFEPKSLMFRVVKLKDATMVRKMRFINVALAHKLMLRAVKSTKLILFMINHIDPTDPRIIASNQVTLGF